MLITKENICVKVCKTKVNNIIVICKENGAEVAPQIVQPSYTELSRTQRGVYQGISAVMKLWLATYSSCGNRATVSEHVKVVYWMVSVE